MTPLALATYIRWKSNVNSSAPWDSTSLLPIVNIAKDNIAQAIAQLNPDYFETISDADTISGQQDYQKPSDLMLLKRLEISYTDTNPDSYHPARKVSLAELLPLGEAYYATYQSTLDPLMRFGDTQFYLYPKPSASTYGTSFLRLWYVPKRSDLANLTESSTDIETTLGIGSTFHELIGDIVVNQIRFKKGELSALDVQVNNAHILDVLIPGAFRQLSTVTSSLPSDTKLQY